MGAKGDLQSNLFLPMGKVRMGCPMGRLGWDVLWVVLWVYPGLSLDVFVVVTSSPPSSAGCVDRRELALEGQDTLLTMSHKAHKNIGCLSRFLSKII